MFDNNQIEQLYGIVGLDQSFNPTYSILDADNLESRSNYKSTDNPFVKIEYLKENSDYIDISDIEFNEFIKRKQITSISNVLNSVFDKSDFRQRNKVYENPLNKVNTTTLNDAFVCDKIRVSSKNNIAFRINRVILDFEGTGDITLQLYSSQQLEPLFEQAISITNTTQIEELNWVVNNAQDAGKGDYLLGYVTNSDLKPFKRDYEASNIKSCFKDLWIQSYQFTDYNANTIPDLRNNDGISDYTGVNADISVFDDYTDLILREERLFAKAIDLQFQINLINTYIASFRSNSKQRISKDLYVDIMSHLEGTNQDVVFKQKGLKHILIGEIVKIRKEIKKIQEGFFGGMLMNRTIT